MPDNYADARLHRLFAEESEIAELGIDVDSHGDHIVLRGAVESEHRREQIARRVAEELPDLVVHNEIAVIGVGPPAEPEALS